ncbi:glycoside hydrolase family 5 protein [candidate division KSB1 bacterium]|nr:glycoside hydrolase family 5 protein [candidate division KSB1 bacterium]
MNWKNSIFTLLLFTLLLSLTGCKKKTNVLSEDPVGLPPFEEIGAFEQNVLLGRGVNFGNALEGENEGDMGMVIQEEYFTLIKQAGFQSLRVPISWGYHALPVYPSTIDLTFFSRIDWVIENAIRAELNAVINCHHIDVLDADPLGNKMWFVEIWRQIADRYKDYPNSVIFEIKNEPHDQFNADNWDEVYKAVLDVIRETNPTRNVVIGPINWNSFSSMNTLDLPENDQHLIATFHYYNPFQFTHQGATGWVEGSGDWLGTTWGNLQSHYARVISDFESVADWAEAENRPVYMGEFGAYEQADMASRVLWTDHVARTAESFDFSWAYWEFGAGFGIYDRNAGEWREELLGALIPEE